MEIDDLSWCAFDPKDGPYGPVDPGPDTFLRYEDFVELVTRRDAALAEGDARPADRCQGCGGRYDFDTSVPSAVWNEVIRGGGFPDYLCASCILAAFVKAGRSFTATLWGEPFSGIPVEVKINGRGALDAEAVSAENNALRIQVRELTDQLAAVERAALPPQQEHPPLYADEHGDWKAAHSGIGARIQLLERAVGNCYMMAKREIARHLNQPLNDQKGLERWQHVQRFCETTGEKSSILRGQLPTEMTEGDALPPAPAPDLHKAPVCDPGTALANTNLLPVGPERGDSGTSSEWETLLELHGAQPAQAREAAFLRILAGLWRRGQHWDTNETIARCLESIASNIESRVAEASALARPDEALHIRTEASNLTDELIKTYPNINIDRDNIEGWFIVAMLRVQQKGPVIHVCASAVGTGSGDSWPNAMRSLPKTLVHGVTYLVRG
jgi:hypothetical protein